MFRWQWSLLAAGLFLWLGGNQAQAEGDLIRLGGPDIQAKTQTLGFDGDVDTQQVWYRGRGWGHGYGGYYGGHYRPYYGFSRPNWGGYYRPFYRPYYSLYRPYYWPSYYGGYYGGYVSPYPTYSYGWYSPCVEAPATSATVVLGQSTYKQVPVPQPMPAQSMFPPSQNGGTYPYNGGPSVIIPEPGTEPSNSPVVVPNRQTVPREGLPVSIPAATRPPTPYFYKGFGEQPQPPAPPASSGSLGLRFVSTPVPSSPTTIRVNYPAFGESSAGPAKR